MLKYNKYQELKNYLEPVEELQGNDRGTTIHKEKKEKNNVDNTNVLSSNKVAIQNIFDEFYKINPTINFGNKTQRKACEDLIKKFGEDKTLAMVQWYIQNRNEKYMPIATNPLAFKNKLGDIKAFADKLKNNITPTL